MPSTSPTSPPGPLHLGLVLFDGCMPAGLFAAADMVRAANLRAGRSCFRLSWVSADGRAVDSWQGPALQPEATLAAAGCDAWLVPGLWAASELALAKALQTQRPLLRCLRELPASAQVWSYCAGVALLAEAGRLNGLSATAAWWLQPLLSTRFKAVRWRFDEPLVSDAGMVTAAGPHGYLPLMLEALAGQLSAEALRDVEDVLMLPRPQAWPAAFQPVELISVADPQLRRLMVFAQRTPADSITLELAARHLGLSVRTLCRQVQAGTGLAAGEWLRRIKLRQAGERLASTDEPVKTVVDQLGFGSEASLYRAFQRTTGCTPLQFRQRYARRR